jgi:hypothetical protein
MPTDHLHNLITEITVDAYGDDEQNTAFLQARAGVSGTPPASRVGRSSRSAWGTRSSPIRWCRRSNRKTETYQGVQRKVDFFERVERVGFYSTFAVRSAASTLDARYGTVEAAQDLVIGDVAALRGPTFARVQFHAESVLTEHGLDIVRDLVAAVRPARAEAP